MTTPPSIHQSCLGCPSYLSTDKVASKFKKSIGAPVCGRFGKVLGKPGASEAQNRKVAVAIGSACPAFGEPLPGIPVDYDFKIAFPVDEPLTEGTKESAACTTCALCKHFVPDRIVSRDLGWATAMCAAKGKLILPSRQAIEARGCEYRSAGSGVRENTVGITLLPEYEDAFNLNADPVKAYFKKQKDGFIEPHEYETDKPVTPEDEANGIRAWRKFVDPEGTGNEAFLPVYRDDFFSDEERLKIPRTGDDEHPELYVDHFGAGYMAAVCWAELDETPALWGEAGTGKTEFFRHMAWLMVIPFERISITAQTEIDDLAGKMLWTQEKGTHFQYGRLPRAWNKPCILCIDEPNVGNPEVWQFIRPLTDNSKQMVLDMNEGERISRNADCYLGMAMNPGWDVRNVGTQQIGDADASRLFHIFMELPPESLEREIIKNRVSLDGWEVDDARLDTVMAIAKDLRDLVKDDSLPITWGIRPQIKVVRAMRWFDPVTAYRRAIADYLEPEAQETLLGIVRQHIGG